MRPLNGAKFGSALDRQGWITYYACPWHHLFTCLARARSTRAKWNSCIWDHFIFDHLLNSYLWMPTKEKFYEYVRNATHGKKCYVIQGSFFWPSRRGFSLFWCRSTVSLQKDDWEIKKEQCAVVWTTFLRWYVNDLLKHYFILAKEEQIFVM